MARKSTQPLDVISLSEQMFPKLQLDNGKPIRSAVKATFMFGAELASAGYEGACALNSAMRAVRIQSKTLEFDAMSDFIESIQGTVTL